MDYSKVPKESIVCLRYTNNPEWVLFTRWTDEVREAYKFSHSEPETRQKHNRELRFNDAMYEHINLENQTLKELRRIYQEGDKGTTRTKIFEHDLFLVLEK